MRGNSDFVTQIEIVVMEMWNLCRLVVPQCSGVCVVRGIAQVKSSLGRSKYSVCTEVVSYPDVCIYLNDYAKSNALMIYNSTVSVMLCDIVIIIPNDVT